MWPNRKTKVTDWKSKLLGAMLSFMVGLGNDYRMCITFDIEPFFILYFLYHVRDSKIEIAIHF